PNFDGYRRYCPYTAEPSATGSWTAPDLARALALVRASGTAGQEVTVELPGWFPFGRRAGRYVVALLDRLGYHARLRETANPYAPATVQTLQIGFSGWVPNFASAADFFRQDLTCRTARMDRHDNSAAFCDPAVDREIARAQAL